MTGATPVDRVVAMLQGAGYRSVDTPALIAGISFDFPAILIGASRSPDLIVVADAAMEGEERIVQRVEGLARALDAMQSKRPMTLIVTGLRFSATSIDVLGRVCRILAAGDASDGEALKNALAVLLPLDLPEAGEDVETGRLPEAGVDDDVVEALLNEAARGEAAVKDRLLELIEEPFGSEEGNEEDVEEDEEL